MAGEEAEERESMRKRYGKRAREIVGTEDKLIAVIGEGREDHRLENQNFLTER
jgi:hypothetical protein